jgi:hypothetical protein
LRRARVHAGTANAAVKRGVCARAQLGTMWVRLCRTRPSSFQRTPM